MGWREKVEEARRLIEEAMEELERKGKMGRTEMLIWGMLNLARISLNAAREEEVNKPIKERLIELAMPYMVEKEGSA